MNKYQEALDCLKDTKCDEINNCEQCSLTSYCGHYQCIKTLQELVDKATPKKVCCTYAPHPTMESDQEFEYYYCPTCEEWLDERDINKYCPLCGQKLDWSDTNE